MNAALRGLERLQQKTFAEAQGDYALVISHSNPLLLVASADLVLARNKRLAFDFWRSVVNGGHVGFAGEILTEG